MAGKEKAASSFLPQRGGSVSIGQGPGRVRASRETHAICISELLTHTAVQTQSFRPTAVPDGRSVTTQQAPFLVFFAVHVDVMMGCRGLGTRQQWKGLAVC